MIIPKEINIGQSKYKIKQVKRVDWRNKNISGQINYNSKELKIQKNEDKRMMQDTFFHEIAHGILKEMEYNYPKMIKLRNDEIFIQELGLNLRKTFLELLKKQNGDING